MVLDATIVKNVGANLRAEGDFAFVAVEFVEFGVPLGFFELLNLRLDEIQGQCSILDLRSLRSTDNLQAGRFVDNSNGRRDFVDIFGASYYIGSP